MYNPFDVSWFSVQMEEKMKKNWLLKSVSVLILLVISTVGCSQISWNDNDNQDAPQVNPADIHFFAKMASRIALNEANMATEDVETIRSYLIAVKNILSATDGELDFASARNLIRLYLPDKYQLYGMTMIDVIERYISSLHIDLTENQELIVELIEAAIDGATEAVDELSNNQ